MTKRNGGVQGQMENPARLQANELRRTKTQADTPMWLFSHIGPTVSTPMWLFSHIGVEIVTK